MILGISYVTIKYALYAFIALIAVIHTYYVIVSDHEIKLKRYLISILFCVIILAMVTHVANIYVCIVIAYILKSSLFYILIDNHMGE